jgi:hypothetical protein
MPRFAYWTIVADGVATAFRAGEREELLPTLTRLRRTSPDAALRWYQHGRLWNSPVEALAARRRPKPRTYRVREPRRGRR